MVGLAVPSTYFCPLDPKYLFFDAPRVLDGPSGSPKFQPDHYIIGDIKYLLDLKNLIDIIHYLDSSNGLVEVCRLVTKCRAKIFFHELIEMQTF